MGQILSGECVCLDHPILPDLSKFKTIVPPPQPAPFNWTGAPSVLYDEQGTIWLTYRMRTREKRGGLMHVARSADGTSFETACTLKAEEFKIFEVTSIERASLVKDPWTGKFKLYVAVDKARGGWYILKLRDEENPSNFDAASAQIVLGPAGVGTDSRSVKDPHVLLVGRRYYMFYIGNSTRCELPHLATSVDGEHWLRFEGNPILPSFGWHDFCTRIAFVMPLRNGFSVFYEGAGLEDHERVTNIRTGLAFSTDLKEYVDLTPQAPILSSPTPGKWSAARYMDYVIVANRALFYYEATRPDDAFELRMSDVPLRE